jgi:hypothetical protein
MKTETRTALAGIETALDVLLTEVIARRKRRPPAELEEWDAGDDVGPIPNRDHSMVLDIIEDPVEGACLLAIQGSASNYSAKAVST